MVEKSKEKEMNKSVAVGNVENNSENIFFLVTIFWPQKTSALQKDKSRYLHKCWILVIYSNEKEAVLRSKIDDTKKLFYTYWEI